MLVPTHESYLCLGVPESGTTWLRVSSSNGWVDAEDPLRESATVSPVATRPPPQSEQEVASYHFGQRIGVVLATPRGHAGLDSRSSLPWCS
ncbi:MAG TPA: hypothetical protein VJK02_19695, partial [Anaerolineales bacterium]|nr:hypothetical protein [Anaerolineales bacterium]